MNFIFTSQNVHYEPDAVYAGGLGEHADDSRGLPVPHSKEEEEVWPEHGAGGHP